MSPARSSPAGASGSSNRRVSLWYGVLLLVLVIILARLFYLQIIQHDRYRAQAQAGQLKEYTITADRGVIRAREGGAMVPIVLNEQLYTLFADPAYVKNPKDDAAQLAAITNGNADEYAKAMAKANSRYVVLAKRLPKDQQKKITSLKLPGIGTQAVNYRTYPQNTLAAQLLGFVNAEGKGSYGVEQALNKELAGTPGRLKAVTDVRGVPLAASRDNIQINPVAGKDIVLTLDIAMQRQLETILKAGLDRVKSESGSAVIIDPNSGAVKAMANWPTYNPAEYFKVEDPNLFNNAVVSSPLEVGSTMKVLTAAAALDMNVIKADTTYYDPGRWKLDSEEITNIEEVGGPGTRSVVEILDKSINTGATWLLMQMGGKTGEVNQKARKAWHNYMLNHYFFSKPTGIEQGYEAGGTVPDPNDGYALELAYANTSFGQAMTATPLQMAAALSAVINGGTYYQPTLIDRISMPDGKSEIKKPKTVRGGVVAQRVSRQVISWMEYVVSTHNLRPAFSPRYSVGGKTGTAQIANPAGGYYAGRYNGTYLGFVGGDRPSYVICVRVNEPKLGKYAGSAAAQPIFADLAHMLINNFNVPPKSGQ